jgi:hypothetical protein
MKLSTHTILNLVAAMNAFDGLDTVKPGQPPKEPYKISAAARMAMAKNLVKLNEVAQAYKKAVDGARQHHSNGGANDKDPEALARFNADNSAFLAFVHNVEIAAIAEGDLALDKNAIPVTVLAHLAPMITGMAGSSEVAFPEPSAAVETKPAGPQANGAAAAA